MSVSFKDILAKPIAEIKAPPPVPMGTYEWRIKGHEFVESGQKKTPGVRFTVAAIANGDDVDATLLAAIGGLPECEMKLTFWISEDSAYRLREFLENDVGIAGPSLEALIPQATNNTFKGYVGQRSSEDGQKIFSEITKTFKKES